VVKIKKNKNRGEGRYKTQKQESKEVGKEKLSYGLWMQEKNDGSGY
jgi:hypothetical protein